MRDNAQARIVRRPGPKKRMGPVVRQSIDIPEDVFAKVEKIAERDDRSYAWVLREAVRRYVEERA